MDVVNMSLSSKSDADVRPTARGRRRRVLRWQRAGLRRQQRPGPTYPSQFASVISVAARDTDDPLLAGLQPPTARWSSRARGVDVEVAWTGGGSIVATGNSFATPHVAGMVALIRSQHPGLTPFQVKAVLHAISENAV